MVEQQLPKKQVKYTKPVVKPDEEVEDEELMPTMEEIRNTAVGATNVEGVGDSIAYDTPPVVEEPPPPPPFGTLHRGGDHARLPGGDRGPIDYLGKSCGTRPWPFRRRSRAWCTCSSPSGPTAV